MHQNPSKLIRKLSSAFVLMLWLTALACGGSSGAKCSPACKSTEVCFAEDGKTYECKTSCTKDEDCTKDKTGQDNLVCHTDENPAHCGEKD